MLEYDNRKMRKTQNCIKVEYADRPNNSYEKKTIVCRQDNRRNEENPKLNV